MNLTRRALLATTAGTAAAPSLAGCAGVPDADGYAVVYALADLADAVAGDRLDVVSPVPTGAHGHGWEPQGTLQTRVATAELFVYLDSPQWRWAQRFVENFERERNADVRVVDALAGLDLLEWGDGHAEHGDHGSDDESDATHDADDESDDGHGTESHETEDSHDAVSHESDDGHETEDGHGADGNESEDDHSTDGGHESDGGHAHGHGAFDPHVWLDPVRARRIVDTVEAALLEIDPDGAATFRSAADDYRAELDALDEAFRAAVETATHDTVLLASHDSFQYVQERYGIRFETPTGFSPDERPSQADVVDAVEFVDQRGLDYVCYDVFEGPRYAEEIVADSTAEAALPLTPLTSRTAAQAEDGSGFVDVMREVNLANLRRAMDSD